MEKIDYFDVITGMAHYLDGFCNMSEDQIYKTISRKSWNIGLKNIGFSENAIRNASKFDIETGMQFFKNKGTFKDYVSLIKAILDDLTFLGEVHNRDKIRQGLMKIVREHTN